MKKLPLLLPIIVSICLLSCTDNEEFDYPTNEITGSFSYTSESTFKDENGTITHTNSGIGGLESNIILKELSITPLVGWSYVLDLANITTHTLADGSEAHSFSIKIQDESVEEETFRIVGDKQTNLYDSDGTVLGVYDGVIYGSDSIRYSSTSYNVSDFKETNTQIIGLAD